MKNIFAKLSILFTVVVTGCTFNKGGSSSSSSSEGEETYTDERNYTYTNRIVEPSSIVHNMSDLKAITDYHAFYKDADNFNVTIADDYVWSTTQRTVKTEIVYLYWYGELINGVIGVTGTQVDSSTWNIQYQYYQNAVIDGHQSKQLLKDLSYKEHTQTRSGDYNNFATEDNSKPVADIATSQQLWYAAEHGYKINPIPNSPAEKYYNKAKQVLRQIIDDNMDDYAKISAIYDYIEHNSTYCYEAADAIGDVPDPENFPDVVCSQYKAFYLEGFFDNGTVVCDGFSKVYTLLGSMEGLSIYRALGTSDKEWESKEVAGHAYCFVELNNKYYLSCPTWGQYSAGEYYDKVVTNKNYFLSPEDYIYPYESTGWENLNYTTTTNNLKYFQDNYITYQGNNYSLYVEDSVTSYEPYFNALANNNNSYIDLYFENYSDLVTFYQQTNTAGYGFTYSQNNKNEFIVWRA